MDSYSTRADKMITLMRGDIATKQSTLCVHNTVCDRVAVIEEIPSRVVVSSQKTSSCCTNCPVCQLNTHAKNRDIYLKYTLSFLRQPPLRRRAEAGGHRGATAQTPTREVGARRPKTRSVTRKRRHLVSGGRGDDRPYSSWP